MLAYFAIIKDSFREALASRVLWIVVLLITVVLLALAPLSYRQQLTTDLREDDTKQWPDIARLLTEERDLSPPLEQIWSAMPEADRKVIRDFKPLPQKPELSDVRDFSQGLKDIRLALNRLLDQKELYDKQAWRGVKLTTEGRMLVERFNKLDDDEGRRLNRLLIESAFPGLIEPSPATSIALTYSLYGQFGEPMPFSKQQLASALRATLPYMIDKGLLAFGLLLAILATAPIIPQTFDPGSLHLLLSKPIGRAGLYLAKFFGGCAFVILCAGYFFAGLYLFLGARLGIWEPRLFWCIPLYAVVFAVYYSVAALAGLIWRSAVVSILLAVVFWGICFGVGMTQLATEAYLKKYRLEKLVPAGDQIFALDRANTPRVWDPQTKQWKMVFLSKDMAEFQPLLSTVAQLPPMIGPVYDPRTKSLVAITLSIKNGQQMIASGKASENWKHVEGPAAPSSPVTMLEEPGGAPLVMTNYGIQRVAEDIQTSEKPIKVLGFAVPLSTRGPLQDAGPAPAQTWAKPLAFAIDGPSKAVFVYSKGTLQRLERTGSGKYAVRAEEKVDTNDDRRIEFAAAGPLLVVAHRDGSFKTIDSKTLKVRDSFTPPKPSRPEIAAGSPDGKYLAVLNRGGQLWLLNTADGKWSQPKQIAGQKDISAIVFTPEGKLLVADRATRVLEYDPTTFAVSRRFSPPLDLIQTGYRYAIWPIYTLFPKPGEFYKTVEYLLQKKEKPDDKPKPRDTDDDTAEPSPWAPVWSSLGFMAVMLAVGCAYMQWQEF
jgi:ABC-type transport system involved in multi-copper enzyme maturation permease subunit